METAVGPWRAQFGLLVIEHKFMGRLSSDIENRLERGWLGRYVLVLGFGGRG